MKNYNCTLVYHKRTTLDAYFKANEEKVLGITQGCTMRDPETVKRCASRYERIQDVRLILLVRYEYVATTGQYCTFCKIKCPISPIPVKGEFEAPSLNAVKHFLVMCGWDLTETLPARLLE